MGTLRRPAATRRFGQSFGAEACNVAIGRAFRLAGHRAKPEPETRDPGYVGSVASAGDAGDP